MRFFRSDKYTAFMYLAITSVTLLIFFSFADIFDDLSESEIDGERFKQRLTGFVALEDNLEETSSEEGKYSGISYFIYYSILALLISVLFFTSKNLFRVVRKG